MTLYHIDGDFLKETPRMEMGLSRYMKGPGYQEHYKKYRAHLASLKSYPILPGSVWKKTKDIGEHEFQLEVWCDDKLAFGGKLTKINSGTIECVRCKAFAVPIAEKERVFTLEEAIGIYRIAWLDREMDDKTIEEYLKDRFKKLFGIDITT